MTELVPAVSVIVPMYNSSDHIGECLRSLQRQTLADFEVICVDDGSTDATADIVSALSRDDARFRLVRQGNAGPGAARNTGLGLARGRFVYCLDSDDFAHRDLLKTCAEALDSSSADLAVFAFRTFNDRMRRVTPARWGMPAIGEFPLHPHGTFTWRHNPDLLFEVVRNVPWNKMVRRSLLVDNGIAFQNLRLTEDAMYSLPAAVCARAIVRIGRPLMCHREYGGDNLMSDRGAHPLDFLEAFASLRAWLLERGAYGQLRLAWQRWLLDAVHYNMPMYRDLRAFDAAFQLLTDDSLRTYDLADLREEDVPNPYHRMLLAALRTGSREDFLLACANVGFMQLEERISMNEESHSRPSTAFANLKESVRTSPSPIASAARAMRK